MNRDDLIARLRQLDLDPGQYWLITGGAMVFYGLREATHDIDLGCTAKLADELEHRGCPVTVLEDGTRKLRIGDDIELFENWIYDEALMVDGLPVISLKGLMEMKRALGREKDYRDIRMIEDFLNKNKTVLN